MRYFPRGGEKYNTYCYNDGGHDCIVNPKFRGGGVC